MAITTGNSSSWTWHSSATGHWNSNSAGYSTEWRSNISHPSEPKEHAVLEKILRLYTAAMVTGVTSPLPHLFGPPGSGKSSVLGEAADLIGVRLHTINLSRVSPLELEGVQMPTTGEDMKLRLLHATYWTEIKQGDIVLFDEFLRAFPEVMNGLLDILTAREVGGLKIPRSFFIAASNSVIAYDKALEDRLLHLPVADPRKSKAERTRIANLIVEALGLHPKAAESIEMGELISEEIMPMYEVMDNLAKRNAPPVYNGSSVRNLIGQVRLREVQSTKLAELIAFSNMMAQRDSKLQYLLLLEGKHPPAGYEEKAHKFLDLTTLTSIQRENVTLNIQLIEFERTKHDTTSRTGGHTS